jgi:hypothetical protein
MSSAPSGRANLRRVVPGVVILFVLAGLVAYRLFSASHPRGERMYWYDVSEKKIFVDAKDLATPQAGVGGAPNDAYPAVVISFTEGKDREVAYLKSFTDELRDLQERAREAKRAGEAPPEKLGDRLWVTANTLVRVPASEEWHPESSPQGLKILSVLTKRGVNNAFPRICSPDD